MAAGGRAKGGLTDQQQRFVDEYLIDLSGKDAAIRAGYSAHSADVAGSKLLATPKIARAVAEAKAARARRTGITADRVLRELARVAFIDAANLIDMDEGSVLAEASADDTACIQAVKVKTTRTIRGGDNNPPTETEVVEREVRIYDKIKALDQLCRHLGIDRKHAPGDGSLAGALAEAEAGGREVRVGVVLLPSPDPEPEPPQEGGTEYEPGDGDDEPGAEVE